MKYKELSNQSEAALKKQLGELQAEVSRKGGHRGHGHGPDKQTASDSAYVNSGGKVNPKGKFIYND